MPGNITIQDSAKRRVSDAAVNELDAVGIVGSSTTATIGTAISLQSVSITYQINTNLKKDAVAGRYRTRTGDTVLQPQQRQFDIAEADQGSIQFPTWTIGGVLLLNSSSDLINFGQLCRMAKTKGYKILSGHEMIQYCKYEENNNVVATSLNVRIENINFVYTPGSSLNKINYTITCVETQ